GLLRAVLAGAAAVGCRGPAAPPVRPPNPTIIAVAAELPTISPARPEPDTSTIPKPDLRTPTGTAPEGTIFRGLTESACSALAAKNTSAANLLDEENRVPGSKDGCETTASQTRRVVRYYTALEFRNQSAAAALERFFQ